MEMRAPKTSLRRPSLMNKSGRQCCGKHCKRQLLDALKLRFSRHQICFYHWTFPLSKEFDYLCLRSPSFSHHQYFALSLRKDCNLESAILGIFLRISSLCGQILKKANLLCFSSCSSVLKSSGGVSLCFPIPPFSSKYSLKILFCKLTCLLMKSCMSFLKYCFDLQLLS